MERKRSVPVVTMPETLGGLGEGCGSGASKRVVFLVRFGRASEGVGGSGEKMRDVVRMDGPRCRWITSDIWWIFDAYPPRTAGSCLGM